MPQGDEQLRLEYIPLAKAVEWDWKDNPKLHDMGALARSLQKNGMIDPSKYDTSLKALIYGNGRMQALVAMKAQGLPPPRGVLVNKQSGEWVVPVMFGVDAKSAAAAKAAAIDHNNLTLMGGDFTAVDMAKMWGGNYAKVLTEIQAGAEQMLTVDSQDIDVLVRRDARLGRPRDEEELPAEAIGGSKNIFRLQSDVFFSSSNKWGIPDLKPEMILECPDQVEIWAGPDGKSESSDCYLWNYNNSNARGLDKTKAILGFYVYDDKFENVWWNTPEIVQGFLADGWMGIIQPNYSMLQGDPLALQLWSTYRSRWCARYFQEAGFKVVPEVNWLSMASFEFSLSGVPQGLQSLSVQVQAHAGNAEAERVRVEGFDYVFKTLAPKHLLVYGAVPEWQEQIRRIAPSHIRLTFIRSISRQLKRWAEENGRSISRKGGDIRAAKPTARVRDAASV